METVDFFLENLIVSRGGDNGNIEIRGKQNWLFIPKDHALPVMCHAAGNSLGTLRSKDGDGNENRFNNQNNNFARASRFFCTFLCRHSTTTAWKCLISHFTEEVLKRRRNYSLFLNSDMVLRNSTLGGFTYVWQSWWLGGIVMKIERTEIHFFAAVAVLDRILRFLSNLAVTAVVGQHSRVTVTAHRCPQTL